MKILISVVPNARGMNSESKNMRGSPATHACALGSEWTFCGRRARGWDVYRSEDAPVNCKLCLRRMYKAEGDE